MEQILKNIKKELQIYSKEDKLKYKHLNNVYQETLQYTAFFSLNRKKHYLEFNFVYQKKEESLSFIYNYTFNSKSIIVSESHSLANYPEDSLPGIAEADKLNLKDIYKFEAIDNQIKNKVDILKQYEVILDIFKRNYKSMMKHVKNVIKIKKTPE